MKNKFHESIHQDINRIIFQKLRMDLLKEIGDMKTRKAHSLVSSLHRKVMTLQYRFKVSRRVFVSMGDMGRKMNTINEANTMIKNELGCYQFPMEYFTHLSKEKKFYAIV